MRNPEVIENHGFPIKEFGNDEKIRCSSILKFNIFFDSINKCITFSRPDVGSVRAVNLYARYQSIIALRLIHCFLKRLLKVGLYDLPGNLCQLKEGRDIPVRYLL